MRIPIIVIYIFTWVNGSFAAEPYDIDTIRALLVDGQQTIEEAQDFTDAIFDENSAKVICYNFMYPLSSGIGSDEEAARGNAKMRMTINRCLQGQLYASTGDSRATEDQFFPPGAHPSLVIEKLAQTNDELMELVEDTNVIDDCSQDPGMQLAIGQIFSTDLFLSSLKCGPIKEDGDYSWIKNTHGEPQVFRSDPGYVDVYTRR